IREVNVHPGEASVREEPHDEVTRVAVVEPDIRQPPSHHLVRDLADEPSAVLDGEEVAFGPLLGRRQQELPLPAADLQLEWARGAGLRAGRRGGGTEDG